jgi:uncharacterized phage protein (TIGR01671 family)
MRKTKFRGWTRTGISITGKEQGEWVYGGFFQDGQKHPFIVDWIEGEGIVLRAVIPETAGQFTGLYDKNGKEIYEGDILKHNPDDDDWNDSVVWWTEKAKFENKSFVDAFNRMSKRNGFEMYQLEGTMCELADWVQGSDNPSLIIGDIHSNPELLEAKE